MSRWPTDVAQALLCSAFTVYGLSMGGCGRVGFKLLPLSDDGSVMATDAARDAAPWLDASTAQDASVGPDANTPQDASVEPDASTAQDASVVPDATTLADASVEPDASAPVDAGPSCPTGCDNPHGTADCASGTCLLSCALGFADCDGSPDNGCETSLETVRDCNGCGITCIAPEGDAVCSEGVCAARCDLTGTFALYLHLSGSWPRAGVIDGGNGSFEFWMKVDAIHTADDVRVQLTECGRTIPPFGAWQVNEDFLYAYPDSLFDFNVLPSSEGTIRLADSSPDSELMLAPVATQLGIRMDDPVHDPWPGQATGIPVGNRIDMDGDGKAGVTAHYRAGDGHVHPRTSSRFFGYNRADRAYAASRVAFSLEGSLSSCTRSSGSATFSHLDTRIFGCRRESGVDCDGNESDYLDDNAQDYSLGAATFTMTRVDDAASCAAVRAALP